MRLLRRSVLGILAVAVCATPVAAAHDHQGNRSPEVVPVHRLMGMTAGELLRDWAAQALAIPAASNPNAGQPPLCLNIGRNGRVVAPFTGPNPAVTCTVKVGQPVFLPRSWWACSSAHPQESPSFAATEPEQRACAIRQLNTLNIEAINVSVDGAPAVDIHDPRFEAISPQGHVVVPTGAIDGATPGPATFVVRSWVATIRHLRVGQHDVRFEVVAGGRVVFVTTVTLNVVRPGRDER